MSSPTLLLRLPNETTQRAGPEEVIGRGRAATVRVDDPRVSTVHAEISWRDGGFVVIARGGRVVLDGVPAAEGRLAVGSRLTLVPGVDLEVLEIELGDAPDVPRTAGRDHLRLIEVDPERVEVFQGDATAPSAVVEGLPARLLGMLARARGPTPWDELACTLWPEDGALRARRGPLRTGEGWTPIDERRLRNRFDQVLASLRKVLTSVRDRPVLRLRQGALELTLEVTDRIELPTGPGAPPR